MQPEITGYQHCKQYPLDGTCSCCQSPSNSSHGASHSQLLLSEWLMKPLSYPPLFPPTPGELISTNACGGMPSSNIPIYSGPLYHPNMKFAFDIKEDTHGLLEIEDRDLLPTLDDFHLVYKDLTQNGSTWPPKVDSFDAESFLLGFYSVDPAFRLIQCATSAYYSYPVIPETVQLSYYKRAKKAMNRIVTQKPTLQTVQAYYAIYGFLLDKGQPLVALEFLKKAMSAMIELRMDFDPDDSPWLSPLNLTSRQKEERRRTFWVIYRQAVYEKAVSFAEIRVPMDPASMKAPSNVMNLGLVFSKMETKTWDSLILHQMGLIKQHYTIPSKSISELLKSDYTRNQYTTLRNLYSSIPSELLLISQDPTHVSPVEGADFVAQILKVSDKGIPPLNGFMVAAVSILYRPILFCTAYRACNPLVISLELRHNILEAITKCLQSAHRIVTLFIFLESVYEGRLFIDQVPENMRTLFFPHFSSALVEAAIVLWFIKCRMDSAWLAYVPLPLKDIAPKVLGLERYLNRIKSVARKEGEGAMKPLAKTVEAMIFEINGVDRQGYGADSSTEIESIEIGMAGIALDEDIMEANAKQVEPKAFMGLLGLEVGSGIRWKGRSEESWRLFWKLNG
ncbi:hypothetical protein BCR33DRAFT_720333 [Rhizoclosmatium globosum]|uniref:Transcription factor domain-containing protein n=1 Tax=Rhizoclosmatium globosum TaxID=329046 RepID=A0A1Y2BWP7_9FUNG|nr:hypothetical protein BCR33DRAFT_720333 [Rhizoclosmatium globosum]|eukprot:ORY39084.1 hypothetical protein BCR33DRAFT_720333 [Rhizoclosmatium globosum]